MLVTSIKSAKNSVPILGYCGYNPFQVLKLSHHENDKEAAFHSPLFSSISGTKYGLITDPLFSMKK